MIGQRDKCLRDSMVCGENTGLKEKFNFGAGSQTRASVTTGIISCSLGTLIEPAAGEAQSGPMMPTRQLPLGRQGIGILLSAAV
jgi:hypothetical protein